jgi:hypothetical protein
MQPCAIYSTGVELIALRLLLPGGAAQPHAAPTRKSVDEPSFARSISASEMPWLAARSSHRRPSAKSLLACDAFNEIAAEH